MTCSTNATRERSGDTEGINARETTIMPEEKRINGTVLRLAKDDLTAMDIESFVLYASPDLVLGSGFGGAISQRAGPSVQEELKQYGTVEVGTAVVTAAGKLKAKNIVHAVGPRFQEADTEKKLDQTIRNALAKAGEKGIRKIALPLMGTGFCGIPLNVSATVMLKAIQEHLKGGSSLEEVVLCANDNREHEAFTAALAKLS